MASAPQIKPSRLNPGVPLLDELAALLGDRLSTSPAVREHHGKDESFHRPVSPDAVAFVRSTEEVSAVVSACARYRVPVIAYGTGTSLEGHVAALEGGVCIDLGQMNDVLEVNPEDLDCTVQAGVTRKQCNEYLRDTGLFFPVDPGRRRIARRHGGNARERHQCRTLWHHAGKRAGTNRGACRR